MRLKLKIYLSDDAPSEQGEVKEQGAEKLSSRVEFVPAKFSVCGEGGMKTDTREHLYTARFESR